MQSLSPGANIPLNTLRVKLSLQTSSPQIADYAGLVWLSFDAERRAQQAHYLHSPDTAAISIGSDQSWQLDLSQLPDSTCRLQLCLYSYAAAGPVARLQSLQLSIEGLMQYSLPLSAQMDAAILIFELYRRQDGWRIRALAEGSAYGLAALGRRLGLPLDEQSPHQASSSNTDSPASSWSGSAFAIDAQHALTCQHVIDGASQIELVSFAGRQTAQLLLSDASNDLALLRLSQPAPNLSAPFRAGSGCMLGEAITCLGFPLRGVTGSGLQVTQGCVSGLLGRQDDCRWLQFTAPIQPGSSGGPLFDASGLICGIVTSTVLNAQNLNFAIKTPLILAFLEAAGLEPLRHYEAQPSLATPELIRRQQAGLWRVECAA